MYNHVVHFNNILKFVITPYVIYELERHALSKFMYVIYRRQHIQVKHIFMKTNTYFRLQIILQLVADYRYIEVKIDKGTFFSKNLCIYETHHCIRAMTV
jgi:hypothetical protein